MTWVTNTCQNKGLSGPWNANCQLYALMPLCVHNGWYTKCVLTLCLSMIWSICPTVYSASIRTGFPCAISARPNTVPMIWVGFVNRRMGFCRSLLSGTCWWVMTWQSNCLCVNTAPLFGPVVPLVDKTRATSWELTWSDGNSVNNWEILYWLQIKIEFGDTLTIIKWTSNPIIAKSFTDIFKNSNRYFVAFYWLVLT
jgi:hypothetical protein